MVGCFIIALLEKFTGKSGSGGKRILKICQHLTMLDAKIQYVVLVSGHRVVTAK